MEHSEHWKSESAAESGLRKWEERSLIEAIRERGYEPDEIVVRSKE